MNTSTPLSDVGAPEPEESAFAPLEAVLIDMDGTAADTEPHWYAAEAEYVEQYGESGDMDDARKLVGTPIVTTTNALRERTGSDDTHEEILAFLIEELVEAISTGRAAPRPGILELIDALDDAGIPTALVTSSHAPLAQAFVGALLPRTFDAVVSGDDVKNLKPDPEPYLLAASKLGVDPAQCVVLEDSPSGIGSGIASGASVIGIPCIVDVPKRENLSRVACAAELSIPLLVRIAAGEVVDTLDDEGEGGNEGADAVERE